MIKQFKKGSYKISRVAVISCLIATTVSITNCVTVKALDTINTTVTTATNITNSNVKHEFLIDETSKSYDDINKVEKVAGLKFKVPDYLPEGYKLGGFHLLKLSDKDNGLKIFFDSKDKEGTDFLVLISEKDPIEAIKKFKTESNGHFQDAKLDTKEESMKLGGIEGSNVTLTATFSPKKMEDGAFTEAYTESNKYFIWKNEGLWYSINYNSVFTNSKNKSKIWSNLPQDDIGKIAKSIKYPAEVKSVSYSVLEREVSTEIGVMSIYDKEDLEKAKKILGFNPKLPLKINEDIKINGAGVGIAGDSDIKNNKINYEINNFYSNKTGSITFNQGKTSRYYADIKKNGYFITYSTENNKPKQIKAEKLNFNNNEVFKYEETDYSYSLTYEWKENDIYYSVTFFDKTENSDEIIKGFVNSKPIN